MRESTGRLHREASRKGGGVKQSKITVEMVQEMLEEGVGEMAESDCMEKYITQWGRRNGVQQSER